MTSTVDLSKLKDKSVLVTGGASGLGLATSRAFAAAGAYVTIADIQGEKTAQELTGNVKYVLCDVTDWESQIQAFKTAVTFSPNKTLDVVALFAGTAAQAGNLVSHVMANEASLDKDPARPGTKCIEINLTGVYYSSFLALNYFRLKPQGQEPSSHANGDTGSLPSKSLIFVSSMAGYIDYGGHSVYNAGKFGVRGLWRSIRAQAANDLNVRCNLIAPWYIDTPMTADIQQYMKEKGVADGQGISFGKIEDVVDTACRCAADEGVKGRAFAIMPEGVRDLGDDLEGKDAGPEVHAIMIQRRGAGDREEL